MHFTSHFGVGCGVEGRVTCALNLTSHTRFTGWLSRDTIWNEIDVLLFPSLHEGFSNAVCEAIGNYAPIIASDIEEHRELLPTAGLYALNLPVWQAVLQSLCSKPDQLNDLAKQQQHFASRYCFDWDQAVVERILASPNVS